MATMIAEPKQTELRHSAPAGKRSVQIEIKRQSNPRDNCYLGEV